LSLYASSKTLGTIHRDRPGASPMMNVTNSVRHRRAIAAGLTVSVVAHVTVLVMVSLPEVAPKEPDTPQAERYIEDFEAIEIIKLVEETPPTRVATASQPAASNMDAILDDPTFGVEPVSLENLLEGIEPATLAINRLAESSPVVTHKDLELISENNELMSALYGDLIAGSIDTATPGGGGLGGILSSIGSALSGGGHCPVPAMGQNR
jgi:hypothetical protein